MQIQNHSLLKSALICVICGLFFFLFSRPNASAQTTKIVTWNLCWFPGRFPDARPEHKRVQMKRAQEALRQIAPDIFLCQEVASWQAVEELTAVVPGLKPAVVSDFGSPEPEIPPQNVAIATRLPVVSGWAQKWNANGRTKYPLARGFAFAAVELPTDKSVLLVYSVHLKSNYKKSRATEGDIIATREESSQILRAHIATMRALYAKAYAHVRVLVGGDFNTSLDDERFKDETTLRAFIADGYTWTLARTPYPERVTIPGSPRSKLPPVGFDHLFTLGLGEPVARVLPVKGVSDHLPVEIVILTK